MKWNKWNITWVEQEQIKPKRTFQAEVEQMQSSRVPQALSVSSKCSAKKEVWVLLSKVARSRWSKDNFGFIKVKINWNNIYISGIIGLKKNQIIFLNRISFCTAQIAHSSGVRSSLEQTGKRNRLYPPQIKLFEHNQKTAIAVNLKYNEPSSPSKTRRSFVCNLLCHKGQVVVIYLSKSKWTKDEYWKGHLKARSLEWMFNTYCSSASKNEKLNNFWKFWNLHLKKIFTHKEYSYSHTVEYITSPS